MGSFFNVIVGLSNSVLKLCTFVIPEGILRREKPLKEFRKEMPVWMDEDYL